MRIAFIVGSYPPAERERRLAMLRRQAFADVEIGLLGVAPSPYAKGFGSEAARSAVPAFVEACLQAQREGYDAVIPLGVLDIGVVEARQALRIPIVGAFESSLRLALFLGSRIGAIAYSEDLLDGLRKQAVQYQAAGSIVGFDHVGIQLPGLAAAAEAGELEDRFCDAAQRLRQGAGADVIVCAGISLCPLHLDRRVLEQRLGLPVVEAVGAPLQMAHALVRQGLRSAAQWHNET